MRTGRLIRALATALLLVGCAAPTEVAPTDDGTLVAEDTTLTDPAEDPNAVASDDLGLVASPVIEPSVDPATMETPAPVVEGTLVLTDLERKNSGVLLWKHCTITAIVTNQASTRLSAELTFVFRKGDKTVETQHQSVDELAPGDSQTFTVKSTASADDGDVTIGEPTSP